MLPSNAKLLNDSFDLMTMTVVISKADLKDQIKIGNFKLDYFRTHVQFCDFFPKQKDNYKIFFCCENLITVMFVLLNF